MQRLAIITITALALLAPCRGQTLTAQSREEIDTLLNGAVDGAKIPGAVLWLERDGKHYHRAYGSRAIAPKREPMKPDTVFDAASLTKVLATAPSVLLLVERGKVKLDDLVRKHLPEFKGAERDKITVRQLLTHTSGLAPILPREPVWGGYATGIKLAVAAAVTDKPGKRFRYSDINFILLGEIVRRVSGRPLDRFAAENLFRPLGMKDTGFNPPAARRTRAAPTTRIDGTKVLQGVVHDPAARAMGGVAGHAGLFTTTADLARFARMMCDGGGLGATRVLAPQTVELLTGNHTSRFRHGVQRGLGWDIDSQYSSPRGDGFPKGESYGHTGWTGCSIWIHPESKSFAILMSNRNHPHERRSIKPLRAELGTLAGEALGLRE